MRIRRAFAFALFFVSFFSVNGVGRGVDAVACDLKLIAAETLVAEEAVWTVIDARPRTRWERSRLPGSLSFCWEDYTGVDENNVKYRIQPVDRIAKALGAMGIDEKTPIAVYGDADTSWGGEGWVCWVLAWLGHQGPIRMLDGGIQYWSVSGLPLESGDRSPTLVPVAYRLQLRPAVTAAVDDVLGDKNRHLLVDTRSTLEWLKGHLPHAVHIPWKQFYQGKDRRPIDADAYAFLLQQKGIDRSLPLIFYCTGGIRSAYAWLVHQLHGESPARNFEGGTEAWARR